MDPVSTRLDWVKVNLLSYSMTKADFRCKDCIYYLNGTCKHSGEYRTTKSDNAACVNFEWINIKI